VHEKDDQPELMSEMQEKVFLKRFDKGTSDVEKYRGWYQTLWPDDPRGAWVDPRKLKPNPFHGLVDLLVGYNYLIRNPSAEQDVSATPNCEPTLSETRPLLSRSESEYTSLVSDTTKDSSKAATLVPLSGLEPSLIRLQTTPGDDQAVPSHGLSVVLDEEEEFFFFNRLYEGGPGIDTFPAE
jgi:hypothetical protein